MCRKYGIKVIVDLHAVQGSQNGNAHSSSRDGYLEWGDSYIQDTVDVIDFLAKRFSVVSDNITELVIFGIFTNLLYIADMVIIQVLQQLS